MKKIDDLGVCIWAHGHPSLANLFSGLTFTHGFITISIRAGTMQYGVGHNAAELRLGYETRRS